MEDKKLFELEEGTPSGDDKIAFGKSGDNYKNITVDDFKSNVLTQPTHGMVTVPIGVWDMQSNVSSSNLELYLPLEDGEITPTAIDIDNIVGVSVIIINDGNVGRSDFLSVQDGTPLNAPQIVFSRWILTTEYTYVVLSRRDNSQYDHENYNRTTNTDGSPFNRGWVTVTYLK